MWEKENHGSLTAGLASGVHLYFCQGRFLANFLVQTGFARHSRVLAASPPAQFTTSSSRWASFRSGAKPHRCDPHWPHPLRPIPTNGSFLCRMWQNKQCGFSSKTASSSGGAKITRNWIRCGLSHKTSTADHRSAILFSLNRPCAIGVDVKKKYCAVLLVTVVVFAGVRQHLHNRTRHAEQDNCLNCVSIFCSYVDKKLILTPRVFCLHWGLCFIRDDGLQQRCFWCWCGARRRSARQIHGFVIHLCSCLCHVCCSPALLLLLPRCACSCHLGFGRVLTLRKCCVWSWGHRLLLGCPLRVPWHSDSVFHSITVVSLGGFATPCCPGCLNRKSVCVDVIRPSTSWDGPCNEEDNTRSQRGTMSFSAGRASEVLSPINDLTWNRLKEGKREKKGAGVCSQMRMMWVSIFFGQPWPTSDAPSHATSYALRFRRFQPLNIVRTMFKYGLQESGYIRLTLPRRASFSHLVTHSYVGTVAARISFALTPTPSEHVLKVSASQGSAVSFVEQKLPHYFCLARLARFAFEQTLRVSAWLGFSGSFSGVAPSFQPWRG